MVTLVTREDAPAFATGHDRWLSVHPPPRGQPRRGGDESHNVHAQSGRDCDTLPDGRREGRHVGSGRQVRRRSCPLRLWVVCPRCVVPVLLVLSAWLTVPMCLCGFGTHRIGPTRYTMNLEKSEEDGVWRIRFVRFEQAWTQGQCVALAVQTG